MGRDGRYFWRTVAIVCSLASGCREKLGPERFKTTRVVGVIRDFGRPVRGGWVEFLPVDGTVGTLRSAPIRTDGSFEVDGVGVGTQAIGVAGSAIPAPYRGLFNSLGSPLRRRVGPGSSTTLNIDLFEERLVFQQKARAHGAPSR